MTYFIKNTPNYEYLMYKYISNLNLNYVPKLYNYNKTTKELKTQKINGLCVSDMYGNSIDDVPDHIKNQIYNIVYELFNNNIVYPDITGYNFIEDKNKKIWIVDFEHCFYYTNNNSFNYNETQLNYLTFVKDFIKNKNIIWNPEFE
jgi:tRNA A-37 threonylcarbamoyl transferase component Bud32